MTLIFWNFSSIIICLKLWGKFFCQKRIKVYCDNLAVVTVINSGKSKCEILQMCLRELAFIAAINQFEIRAIHLGSNENRIADHFRRWNLSECHRQPFYELTSEYKLTECVVSRRTVRICTYMVICFYFRCADAFFKAGFENFSQFCICRRYEK